MNEKGYEDSSKGVNEGLKGNRLRETVKDFFILVVLIKSFIQNIKEDENLKLIGIEDAFKLLEDERKEVYRFFVFS